MIRPALAGAFLTLGTLACMRGEDPCTRATASAVLVEKGEPGEPLRVRGTVYFPDGVTPAAGVILYVYQTDSKGRYIHLPSSRPRIKGWLRTDEKGAFEFLTIRPGAYPSGTTEAHIHTQLWGPGVEPQWNADLLFEDDPLLPAAKKTESETLGRFGFVKSPVKGPDGVLETTLDIRLSARGTPFEDNILHGVKPCGVNPP